MKQFKLLASFAMILALIVVMLGAYTRLTHAGLGCPDWPGCYGKLLVPTQVSEQIAVQKHYPTAPLETQKAWTEMIHRYVAGTLAVLIVVLNILAWRRHSDGIPRGLPAFLLGLIGFQAALGMWTVTLKLLPIVVMGHLLGGLLIFGGLVYLNLMLHARLPRFAYTPSRFWLHLAVVIVFCQIALGGWVSANYAGLACVGFPQCNGQWLPLLNWKSGFQFWSTLGINYQGGVLDSASRMAIQMVHRIGAFITVVYLFGLAVGLLKKINTSYMRNSVMAVLVLLFAQFALGIINVIHMLPLWAAVAHNGMAALLFASVLNLHFTGCRIGASHVRSV